MPKDYDLESSTPFTSSDIISVVPVCKVVAELCNRLIQVFL